MATLEEIRKDLPDWSDEVSNEWLVYLSNRADASAPLDHMQGNHLTGHLAFIPLP
jgi:hypothetical protein